MAGKRQIPLWHQSFLRALRRLGNVRQAAFEAGVDVGTAYNHRRSDKRFAGRWAAALAAYKEMAAKRGPLHHRAARGGPPPRSGEELVLRRTKHGDKLVRASPGRWSGRAEEVFLATLGETGCVESAAAACGISKNALYQRRAAYPEFAAKWDRVLAVAKARLPDMLTAAAIASLDPAAAPRRMGRLPHLNIDHAIRITAIEQRRAEAEAKAAARRGRTPTDPETYQREEAAQMADLAAALTKLIAQVRGGMDKQRLAEGWQRTPEGHWIPPGWVRAP